MPGRVARSNVPPTQQPKTSARNKNRKRHLDAFAIAGHEHADNVRIKQHRLGEILDDGPSNKRRRIQEQEDDDGDDSDGDSGPARRKNGSKRQLRDADDSVEEGSDSEGNEWTLGGLGEDDDDSDLDSDLAFGESDEERFEGFTFRGSSKNKGRQSKPTKMVVQKSQQGEIDLNEDDGGEEDEDIEDDFGDEGVDLATMLDDDDEEEGSGDEEETEDDLGEYSGSDSEDAGDVDDEERNARILDMANEYGGDSAAESSKSKSVPQSKLTAADLLAGFDGESRRTAEKSIKPKKKVASETLSAPLPKRQQDKLDRQAASEKAKEQLDRWRDTVMQNRRAEFLQFPLKLSESGAPSVNKEKFMPATQDAPSTELEANIRKIMEESGLSTSKNEADDGVDAEDGLLKAEALSTNKMPVEEVRNRIAELRRHRDLLFREEIKAKRIKNIKSKAYRRVHRRQREREAQEEAAFLGEDGELDENEREKRDRKRAEARMGTRHKDSKWAKSLKATNRTAWDENARDSVLESARRQEELKRRIAGDDISEQSGSDIPSSSDDEGLDDEGDDGLQKRLNKLSQQDEKPGKGLAGMKFMQAADARRKAQNDEDVERIRRDLAIADGDAEESEKEEEEGLGRAIFGPRPKESKEQKRKTQRAELEEGSESNVSDDDEVAGLDTPQPKAKGNQKQSGKNKSSGPLAKSALLNGVSSNKVQEQRPAEVESSWLSAEPEKSGKSKKQKGDDVDALALAINPSEGISNGTPEWSQPSKKSTQDQSNNNSAGNTEGWTTVTYNNHQEDNDSADSEAENDGQPMLTKAQQKADFHRRAFAGDDVHLSFAADKEAAEESEDEKETSNHLPGWGSWAGDGLSKRAKKHNNRIKHNPLHKHKVPGGTAKNNRKDKGRTDVIISEKGDRKGAIYKAKVLPHGFESKDQYERSLRMPIGPEWSTKETFQRSTRPRVVTAPGQVIEAIERPAI